MLILHGDDIFGAAEHGADLARKSVRSGAVTLVSQVVLFALQIVITVFLARLLTPADFGLISMVAVFMGFGELLRDAGLASATIQKTTITHDQISTVFWANVALSVLLGAGLAAAAPIIAVFYHQPDLTAVTMALAIGFAIGGFSSQHAALLQRHMFFTSAAVVAISSKVVYLVTAVVLAMLSARYWSLVAGAIAQSVATVALTYFMCRWTPGRPRRGAGARVLIRFGGNVLGFNIVNYFTRNMDNILIGRHLGPGQLGLYSKAYGLFMLPIDQIRAPLQAVGMPVLSSLRTDSTRYARYYYRIVTTLGTLTVPIVVFCAAEAPFIIELLLGSQWLAAVPVFRVLAISALIQPVSTTRGLVMLSWGLPERYFRFGVINAVVTVSSFVAGLRWGIVGVAAAYALANYLILVPSLWYCFRDTPIRTYDFLASLVPSIIIGALCGSVFALELLNADGSRLVHVAISVAFGCLYGGLSVTRRSVRETMGQVRAAFLGRA